MNTPKCPACQKPWEKHDGIERTCRALAAAIDALRKCRNTLSHQKICRFWKAGTDCDCGVTAARAAADAVLERKS